MSTPRFCFIEVWIASSRLRRSARGSVRSLSVSAVTGCVSRFACASVAVVGGRRLLRERDGREGDANDRDQPSKGGHEVPPRQGSTTYSKGESFVESSPKSRGIVPSHHRDTENTEKTSVTAVSLW